MNSYATNREMTRYLIILLILLMSTYLIGCGGGSDKFAGIDAGGAPAATSTSGTLNGFGSIIVNGIRYNSDKAKIQVNGQIANENDLRPGYQVKLTGTLNKDNTGTADTVEFFPTIIGKISSIDLQNNRLVLLGQNVQIDNATLFDDQISPNYLNGLKVGDSILVSGLPDSAGVITATRIELAPQMTHQIVGFVSNLDAMASTFMLNNLKVNFSAATLNDFPNNQLKNGSFIRASGDLNQDGIFVAKVLNYQAIDFKKEIKSANIEGFITRFVSSTDFDVAGIPCTTTETTSFVNGDKTSLVLGARLKIKGDVNSSNQLVAKTIELQQRPRNQIAGEVSNIVAEAAVGTIAVGSFQIANTTVKTTNTTNYEDKDNERLKRFNFSDIQAGNFLKVSGYIDQTNFIATKIERIKLKPDMELEFSGKVTHVEPHNIQVYGRSVQTNAQTEIRDINGNTITEAEFVAQALNLNVKVKGKITDSIFTATKIEVEEEERKKP
jgi:hypothetical protein